MIIAGEDVEHRTVDEGQIVPLASAVALGRIYRGRDYRQIRFPSSHVGLSTSRKAIQLLWPQVIQWIKAKA